jgi:TrmH family RNA methyltransferase
MNRLREARVPILVADATGVDARFRLPETLGRAGFALVVGNEGAGVRPQVVREADESIAVRMPGPAESLNVAMAASILLHSLTREDA